MLLVLAYLIVGYLTLTPGHYWGDDWAQYVNHARNLVLGRPYAETGYVFNPAQPHVGPPAYSPGLPLLLAPIVKFMGINILALKCESLAFMAIAMLLTFLLYRDTLGPWVGVAAAAFFGLHDGPWLMRDVVHSEPSYIVWTLAALYFAGQPLRGRGIGAGVACGVLSYAAFATRPIGAALIIAAGVYEIIQRRLISWRFLCIVGIPAIGIVLQKHFLAIADYSNELRALTPQVLIGNVASYWRQADSLFPLGSRLSLLSPLVVLLLTTLGVGYALRRRIAPPASSSLTARTYALLLSVPVDLWYLGIYCGTLVALPFVQEARYLVPTLPIVCAYIAYGVSQALAPTRYARPTIALICILLCGYYGALHWKHDSPPHADNALCADCQAMYAYLTDNTPPGTTVAFAKPRALALLTGRRGWMWAPDMDQQSNWQEMTGAHIDYVVIVAPDSPLAQKYPPYLSWDSWRSNPRLRLVFENPSFRVLRLQPASS